jgi:hypothetical protein
LGVLVEDDVPVGIVGSDIVEVVVGLGLAQVRPPPVQADVGVLPPDQLAAPLSQVVKSMTVKPSFPVCASQIIV